MFIKIGSSKEASDVVDLLMECHERIRFFVALAGEIAKARRILNDQAALSSCLVCMN